jgi:subtilisin family serine protease
MRRVLLLAAIIVTGLAAWMPSSVADPSYEIIVQVYPGTNVDQMLRDYHVRIIGEQPDTLTFRLVAPPSIDMPSLAVAMNNDPRVVTAELNQSGAGGTPPEGPPLPTFQLTASFDAYGRPAVSPGWGLLPQVNYHEAAELADGTGIIVAVLDTGMSPRHQALAARTLPGWNFIDGTPNTDDVPDFKDNNKNGTFDEAAGHGTMVAGLVTQFAPGASLMPVKVLDSDGDGNLWTMIQGIRYSVEHGARVVICTFGFPAESRLLDQAIRYAERNDVVVVASAGNNNTSERQYPGGNAKVLTVAALDSRNRKAPFSNFGTWIDVCAPGVDISSIFWDGSFKSWSGTSFAAPMVGAEAALIIERVPTLSAQSVRQQITKTSHSVDKFNPRYKNLLGKRNAGLIDFDAALTSLNGVSAD